MHSIVRKDAGASPLTVEDLVRVYRKLRAVRWPCFPPRSRRLQPYIREAWRRAGLLLCLLLALALGGCGAEPETSVAPATPYPTYTPRPTYTPAPTVAVTVQVTRIVVVTPTATPTPLSTATPTLEPANVTATAEAAASAALRSDKEDGNYLVGVDIAPGTWRNSGMGDEHCYWARLDKNQQIIDNDLGAGGGAVTIHATDFQFHSERCGTWTFLSP